MATEPAATRFRIRRSGPWIPYVLGLLFLGTIALISNTYFIMPVYFTRDPTALMEVPSVVGIVSSLGNLLWGAAATTCLLGWSILRPRTGEPAYSRYFLFFGALTLILLLDDLFLIHEELWARFRLPETVTYLVYVGLTVFGLVTFRKTILETRYRHLLIALTLLASSAATDRFQRTIEDFMALWYPWRAMLEDGFKFLGIIAWLTYFVVASRDAILRRVCDERPAATDSGEPAELTRD